MTTRFTMGVAQQLGFLRRSCDLFDAGHVDEAIRMAVAIRVLLHDTARQRSLVSALSGNGTPRLLSTARNLMGMITAPNDRAHAGLFYNGMALLGGDAGYGPKLGGGATREFVSAQDWKEQIVMIPSRGMLLSRMRVVLVAADKDGGAHVDATIPADYAALAAPGAMGTLLTASGDVPLTDSHLTVLRQVTYELLNSPDLLALGSGPVGRV